MASPPPTPPKRVGHTLRVVRRARITPNMIRVTLTGPHLASIPADCAGGHFKLFLPEAGQSEADFATQMAEGPRPTARTYTVRHARPEVAEIDVDFVAHGDEGPASAWAEAAKTGSFCGFAGPGAPKLIDFDADWYLIAADMSALPVAAASLEALPADARGLAVFEITSAADRQEIEGPAGVEQKWFVHDDPHTQSDQQLDLIRALDWPAGSVRTMIAGETGVIRALRLLTRGERGVDRKQSYVSGYWRIGLAEDEHQKVKRQETEQDERTLGAA
ncbi:MAG: siderophore-interacting protein [Pseudomonadota bacterium]